MIRLEMDDALGHRRRAGSVEDRARPVLDDAVVELRAGRFGGAALLVDHFMELAAVKYRSYHRGRWLRIGEWLLGRGMRPEEFAELEARIRSRLAMPGEAEFSPDERWESLSARAGVIVGRVRTAAPDEAEELVDVLDELRTGWQHLHDRSVDYLSALLAHVVREFGEPALGYCMAFVIEGSIPDAEDVAVTLERMVAGMVGHLSGPGRRGSVEVREEADRWVLTFDPCGSGGRSYLPDGAASDKVEGAYDWTWQTRGICHYCTHCAIGVQSAPIDRNGLPMADVYPPTWDPVEGRALEPRCRYVLYKSPEAVPDSAYERVGRRPPG